MHLPKKIKYSESGCLTTIYYILNTSPSSKSNLVYYWEENNILDGADFIQFGKSTYSVIQHIPIFKLSGDFSHTIRNEI